MTDDPPVDPEDCHKQDELLECLQQEAKAQKCGGIKKTKRALANNESVGALPPEAVASAFLTIIENDCNHHLRLECADGLALTATDNPRVLLDFYWDMEDLLLVIDDPAIAEYLINTVVDLVLAGPPGAAREVTDTLAAICKANEPVEYVHSGELIRQAAIEGLQKLAVHGNSTVRL